MMLLNETVSDLFICNFIGLCKTVQNVYILLTLKGQKKKKNLCLSVYHMSEITHANQIQAYLLEKLQGYILPHKICSCLT